MSNAPNGAAGQIAVCSCGKRYRIRGAGQVGSLRCRVCGSALLIGSAVWRVGILGVGPAYLVAWFVVLGAPIAWTQLARLPDQRPPQLVLLAPFVSHAIDLHCGYIIFRTLGLLYRHYRTRFPWQC